MFSRKLNNSRDTYIYSGRMNKYGLTSEEAALKLEAFGENVLVEKKRKSWISIFLSQFNDFIIWVLLGATAISVLLGEKADAITIAAIVVLNGIMGFIQEYRTEKSMDALKELTAPVVKAVRDGRTVSIPARYIVPDDLVLLEAGDRVPADSILIESVGMQVDESLLTGESVPADKESIQNEGRRSLAAGSENVVFMGTVVTAGRGKAVVTATGMETEMGKIADMLQSVEDEETPLQRRLEKMGKIMVFACLLACLIVTAAGIMKGENIYVMFLTGVSLAVAAIPEGLPAIVTVSLTIGVQRMLKRNALIRRLPAVETLGCTKIICSDKTGTLTENRMTVKAVYYNGSIVEITGNGYDTEGDFMKGGRKIDPSHDNILKMLLETAVACTNSEIYTKKPGKLFKRHTGNNEEIISTSGDPTEIALLVCGYKAGITRGDLNNKYERIGEVPFDSDRKRMSVVVMYNNDYYLFLKGAIDNTIGLCSSVHYASGIRNMTRGLAGEIQSMNSSMGQKALRVLAIAYRRLEDKPSKISESLEKGMTFLGLIGMIDPPRKEAIEAVQVCKVAGIKPVMITGDHRDTAVAVARELDILGRDEKVLTGREIDEMSDLDLSDAAAETAVFARVTPKHKLRIVKAYKNRGSIVAMTGDGVNDAPAVKEADIGISMGETGTDVTREASSMVLLDDNFATIVSAVEEGRIIYDNIRKFIRYLLSCNLGEILTMFAASLLGLSIPLLPIQILWVNLVTDGLPAIALGVDPPDHDIMLRPPRHKDESIFSHGLAFKIILRGMLIGICTLAVFIITLKITGGGLMKARTMAFAVIVMSQLIHVFECRSERHSIFEINFLGNLYLVLAVCVSVSMLLIAIYVPALQTVFKTVGLVPGDWVEIIFFSGAISLIVNLRTYIKSGAVKKGNKK